MLQLTTIFFLIAFFVLAVIQNIAVSLYLYWRLPWFDVPMHFLGGAVVALGFYTLRDLGLFPDTLLRPIPVVLLVLCVAFTWEFFEYFTGLSLTESAFIFDTSLDLLMGTLGGVVGYLVGNSIRSLH